MKHKEEENSLKNKQDEINKIYQETEELIKNEVKKYEQKYHMKEEECTRLKQILYTKEDIIRKISIAYEQVKNEEEAFKDQIEYYREKAKEIEKLPSHSLLEENINLKEQNKQLLVTLIGHLTKKRSLSRKSSKRKKSRLNGTQVNIQKLRKSVVDNSKMRLSRRKKGSQRKHSSKRRKNKERMNLNNLNSMLEYKYMPSLTSMNKNLAKNHNNQLINNYQSFDSTLSNSMLENILAKIKISGENNEGYADPHYHSVKTPQGDKREFRMKPQNRPKTAVRRKKERKNRRDELHSSSQQVQYNNQFENSGEISQENIQPY